MSGLIGLLLAIRRRFEVDHDRFLRIAHDDPLRDCVGRIEFLMGHERGHVDEVAGLHVLHEFEVVAPANLCMAGDYIDDGFETAVVVFAAGNVWVNVGDTGPDALRSRQFA